MAEIGYFSNSVNYARFNRDDRTEDEILADARARIKAKNEELMRKRDEARAKKKAEEEGHHGDVHNSGLSSIGTEIARSGGDSNPAPTSKPSAPASGGQNVSDGLLQPPATSTSSQTPANDRSTDLMHISSDSRLSSTHTTPPTCPTSISFADPATPSSSVGTASKPEKKSGLKNLFKARRKSYQEKERQNSIP